MGHQHLGTLPRSKRWLDVVALISAGADVQRVAAATSTAAERQMIDASNDPTVKCAFWLLTQIPQAAKKEHFEAELRKLGLSIRDQPSLIEIAAAMNAAIDQKIATTGGRSDLGEMAQLAAVESLSAVAGRELYGLFGAAADKTQATLAGLGTVQQFAVLARDFFSRLARRQLAYYLSRELSNHVGEGSRFRTVREHAEFEAALDLHCREVSRIVKEFSGEWYSKKNHEGGIDQATAGRFAHIAFKKIRDELKARRGVDA
jgi:hypothetical protein